MSKALSDVTDSLRSLLFRTPASSPQDRVGQNHIYVKAKPRNPRRQLPLPVHPRSSSCRRISISENEKVVSSREERVDDRGNFSRLPAEIRDMIWKEAIDGKVVHMWVEDRRLKGFICSSQEPVEKKRCFMKCWARQFEGNERIGVWGLVGSCRLLYTELIDRLYANTIFNFHNREALAYLPSLVPAKRVRSITTIYYRFQLFAHPAMSSGQPRRLNQRQIAAIRESGKDACLETWFRIWETVGDMNGLKDVNVELDIDNSGWTVEDLKIIPRLQGGGKVILRLHPGLAFPLQQQMEDDEDEESNFQISFADV